MNEEEYKKLSAAEKKAVDTVLRRIPRTLDNIEQVTTDEPSVATGNKNVVQIMMSVQFDNMLTEKEQRAVRGEPDLFRTGSKGAA